MVRVQIHPDLARRRHDEVHRRQRLRPIAFRREALPYRSGDERGPLVAAQRPRQHRDALRAVRPGKAQRNELRVRHPLHVDRNRTRARRGRLAHRTDAGRRLRDGDEARGLARVETPAHRLVREVLGLEGQHGPGSQHGDGPPPPSAESVITCSSAPARSRASARRSSSIAGARCASSSRMRASCPTSPASIARRDRPAP